MNPTIALVDDDRNILTSVSIILREEGFATRVYSDAETALKALVENAPDLAIFDIKMPRMDGLELLRRFRERSAAPVIFLTSKDDELDEALGLSMGADDYIAKPFNTRLLIARIRAILRRTELNQASGAEPPTTDDLVTRGRLTMDPARHRTSWRGETVVLTVTEFLILETLASRAGIVKTRNQLMDAAYQDDVYVDDRTIDSHIKRLRRKFREVDPDFDAIETLYGAGYRFSEVEPLRGDRDLTLRWSGQVSLTQRILAVNILVLLMMVGGFFYLDSYRSRIIDSRLAQSSREVRLIAEAIAAVNLRYRDALVVRLAHDTGARIRIYDEFGRATVDSRRLGLRNFTLVDPDKQGWDQRTARLLDAGLDTVVGAERSPLFRERSNGLAWADVREAAASRAVATTVWRAPDRTPVLTAAAPLPGRRVVLTATTARDITQTVRVERFRLGVVLMIATIVSVLLSLFLARTIVRPLRRLARAAVRVRLGRAREVVVPRLPSRRDELGLLARALSDMSLALRAQIDATEAFAADVTHELKNPLASLRSAVDGLARVRDPALVAQLMTIVEDDIRRLDRLITDISEASRLDAQLSRAKFEPVDLAELIAGLLRQRSSAGVTRGIRLRVVHGPGEPLIVMGDGPRLERVFENLLDNAISFSPDGGLVALTTVPDGDSWMIEVEDAGPGVPEAEREAVFGRFQSVRPSGEAFGRHSGLGLAIARTIVEGHQGSIIVEPRGDRTPGARFVVRLPVADPR